MLININKSNLKKRVRYFLALILALSQQAFAADDGQNQPSYPDWNTRWPATELYEADCGPLWKPEKYGPFDYRSATPGHRARVEDHHFNVEYQDYLRGNRISSREQIRLPIAAGFGYTLWSFPNHPTALAAIEGLGMRYKSDNLPAGLLRAHCFMQRAVRFTPDDPLVRSIYGYYYARRGKAAEARAQLEKLETLETGNSSVFVYSAFAYIEIKDYEHALISAKRAYQLGYTLPGLRNHLERLGKWNNKPLKELTEETSIDAD